VRGLGLMPSVSFERESENLYGGGAPLGLGFWIDDVEGVGPRE
jgi:hypothetical protein